jgi:ATP adenylyltransferase
MAKVQAKRRSAGGGAKGGARRKRGAAARRPAGRGPQSVPARLWAPWRAAFIHGPKPAGCIFCDFPAQGEANDRANLIVHRSAHAFAILNRYPYNSGHLMVVPRQHGAELEALPPEAFEDLHAELLRAVRAVRAAYEPEGLNLGMNLGRVAGAGIADHLHYHIVPRWGGDTNFMPVAADTRVMIELLDASWLRLREAFDTA